MKSTSRFSGVQTAAIYDVIGAVFSRPFRVNMKTKAVGNQLNDPTTAHIDEAGERPSTGSMTCLAVRGDEAMGVVYVFRDNSLSSSASWR